MRAIATKFTGLSAFIVTPTKMGGDKIDYDALRRAIDVQIAAGVDSITIFGSTGGIGLYSAEERRQVIDASVRHINGRVKLIAGTGAIATSEAVELSKYAEAAGADAVIIVPISYWKMTDDELFDHFKTIAEAVSLPVGLYNNPGTTGIDMLPPLIARIARIENVAFLKESAPDVRRITATISRTQGQIAVMTGICSGAPAAFAAGAHGWFAGSCSIIPDQCVEIFRAGVTQRNITRAIELFEPVYPIIEFMSAKGYIRVAHAAAELLGRPVGPPRPPIAMLASSDMTALRKLLANAGLIPAPQA